MLPLVPKHIPEAVGSENGQKEQSLGMGAR